MANTYKYRADQVGRLVAPPDAEAAGHEAALKRLLAMQKASGLSVATDGEMTRRDIAQALAGRGAVGDPPRVFTDEAAPAMKLATLPIKISLPTPASALKRLGPKADDKATAEALLKAITEEVGALIAGGVPYIQLNGTAYADLLEGEEDDAQFEALLGLDRRLLSSIEAPNEVRVALRIARRADAVWKDDPRTAAVLSLPVRRMLLSYPVEPPDFAVLALAHPKADLVLGLVDNAGPAQDADKLLGLIDRAAKVVEGDRLALSPHTGFTGSGQAAWDGQRRTLEHIADVATRWWGFAM